MTVVADAKYPLVAIGGVGGSGTRVVAEIVKQLGYYIGNHLNEANDNLWFTLLFKREEIISASDAEFDKLVQLFINKMRGTIERGKELEQLLSELTKIDRSQHSREVLLRSANSFWNLATDMAVRREGIGWKEPNTHMVIGRIRVHVPGIKYIHVIRNGLDMAYSENQNQLEFWGKQLLGYENGVTPRTSLNFWCAAHRKILSEGKTMGSRFLLLNFDDLCRDPDKWLDMLVGFLDIQMPDKRTIEKLTKLIHPPPTIGRFKQYGLAHLDPEDVEYVSALGFDVDPNSPRHGLSLGN